MDNNRFTELLNLYLLDRITDQEGAELAALLQAPGFQHEFERQVGEQLEKRTFDLENPPSAVHTRIQAYLDREMGLRPAESGFRSAESRVLPADGGTAQVHRVHFLRRPFWRYAAVVFLAIAGVYVYQRVRTPALLSQEKRFKNDLQPGSHRATLTLADGKQIPMTGALASLATTGTTGDINITTAKGETYSLVLSDGTKVWLNSSSTLHCPAVFEGDQRRVELRGEGYFEVRHDAKKPFSVQLPDGSLVKDLGTRFNIHAYGDEQAIRTTVLEGSVLVEAKGKELSLVPGEQAEYSTQEELTRHAKVDLPHTVAWKEEKFLLEATPISAIMKQVERWYGAEIVYRDNMQNDTTEFFGTLTRNVPVSQLLRTLEATGHVHFIIEGNSITVMK